MFGSARKIARSSVAWWLGPYPVVSPGSAQQILTGKSSSAIAMQMKS